MREVIKLTARKLRKDQTDSEKILWSKLRNRGYLNFKFTRQHPIVFEIEGKERFFIADFFCDKNKLVIEIDGDIHREQKEYDQYRDQIIQGLGLRVIRVASYIIEKDLDSFLKYYLGSNPENLVRDEVEDYFFTPLLLPREGAGDEFVELQRAGLFCRG